MKVWIGVYFIENGVLVNNLESLEIKEKWSWNVKENEKNKNKIKINWKCTPKKWKWSKL